MLPSEHEIWSDKKGPYIKIRRFVYEEPYHVHLEFWISNGEFCASTDVYFNTEQLVEIGNALRNFPSRIDQVFTFEYGSENPADRFYRYFSLRAYTVDAVGHCALQFRINRNAAEPYEGIAQFSLTTGAAGINRLGDLLVEFSLLKHLELRWTDSDGELFEAYQ